MAEPGGQTGAALEPLEAEEVESGGVGGIKEGGIEEAGGESKLIGPGGGVGSGRIRLGRQGQGRYEDRRPEGSPEDATPPILCSDSWIVRGELANRSLRNSSPPGTGPNT